MVQWLRGGYTFHSIVLCSIYLLDYDYMLFFPVIKIELCGYVSLILSFISPRGSYIPFRKMSTSHGTVVFKIF